MSLLNGVMNHRPDDYLLPYRLAVTALQQQVAALTEQVKEANEDASVMNVVMGLYQ